MKYLLSFIFILITTQRALAQNVEAMPITSEKSFFIDSWGDFGDRVYYNCADVEYKVRTFLQKIGAQNVRVQCTGGIDDWQPPAFWDASVYLRFTTLRTAKEASDSNMKAQWKRVNFTSFDGCHLYNQIFKRVKDGFEVKSLRESGSCPSFDQQYRVQFETLQGT